jgi:hypothetical protein
MARLSGFNNCGEEVYPKIAKTYLRDVLSALICVTCGSSGSISYSHWATSWGSSEEKKLDKLTKKGK